MPGSDGEDAGFNTQELANTLRTMAKIRRIRLEVFDSLCQAVAAKMRDLNAHDVANTRWAMAKIGRVLPEVFDSLCQAATVKMPASTRRSDVANTRWAMAKITQKKPEVEQRLETRYFPYRHKAYRLHGR